MNQLPAFQQTTFTPITGRDGAPWVTSSDLNDALGYTDRSAVTRIYQRNAQEFTEAMTDLIRLSCGQSDRMGKADTRIFSLRGAHLVAMFAKTPRAAAFRAWVLDVLEGLATARTDALADRLALWLAPRAHCTTMDAAEALGLPMAEPAQQQTSRARAAALLRLAGWKRQWVRGGQPALLAPAAEV